MFTLPTFRWALLTPILPTSSQASGSHRGILPIPQLLEFLIVGMCLHSLTSLAFLPLLAEFQPIVFPPEFILQLLRDLCSHVACLPLHVLSPVYRSLQWCHGHPDTISMPFVSCLGVITHLQHDLKESFSPGDQDPKTPFHSHRSLSWRVKDGDLPREGSQWWFKKRSLGLVSFLLRDITFSLFS